MIDKSEQLEHAPLEWVEINIPFGPVFDYSHGISQADSLSNRGLNKPGTLVRMLDGTEFLIGHINEMRGVCDDCTEFPSETIVNAYMVVWQAKKAEDGGADGDASK